MEDRAKISRMSAKICPACCRPTDGIPAYGPAPPGSATAPSCSMQDCCTLQLPAPYKTPTRGCNLHWIHIRSCQLQGYPQIACYRIMIEVIVIAIKKHRR
ncbi:Hypothetical predicted protein, partial [Xyrichtys novacula]